MKDLDETLRKIEGLQTVEMVAEALNLSRQSALNLLSKLKKEGYVTVKGGGKLKRLYRVTMWKQRKREPGMFDIINKYSPMKINPWYEHQVHGAYGPEEALIDAIQTRNFRVILASLRLFSHIKDWKKLYRLAKEKDLWQEIGALHELSSLNFRVRKIPLYYPTSKKIGWKQLTQLNNRDNFPEIQNKWHVYMPFNKKDMEEIK